MIKIIVSFLLFINLAEAKYYNNYSFSLGMINHSVAENESTLVSTDDPGTTTISQSPEAVSAISLDANYEFMASQKRAFFVRGSAPLMATNGAGVFLLGGGVNFYLSDLSTKYSYEFRGNKIEILPEFKYYWGVNSGVGYLVYNTISSKKSDVFFDVGVHGGGAYALSDKRAIKAEAGLARSTGIATTGFKINIFVGLVQYL